MPRNKNFHLLPRNCSSFSPRLGPVVDAFPSPEKHFLRRKNESPRAFSVRKELTCCYFGRSTKPNASSSNIGGRNIFKYIKQNKIYHAEGGCLWIEIICIVCLYLMAHDENRALGFSKRWWIFRFFWFLLSTLSLWARTLSRNDEEKSLSARFLWWFGEKVKHQW